jgi:circadian clock protein KaiC
MRTPRLSMTTTQQKKLGSDSTKSRTGIDGFDEVSSRSLPSGRTARPSAGPGSGETIFALQFLTNGARNQNEQDISVAFEETSEPARRNIGTLSQTEKAVQALVLEPIVA